MKKMSDQMNREVFSRTQLLLGEAALDRLAHSTVAIFGVGGVGSYVVEALARSGVGHLVLIDSDVVALSNINRQLLALHSTVGRPKVDVMRERILDINPDARVETIQAFVLPDNAAGLIDPQWDYIVDAIDTVSAKIELAVLAAAKNIPLISSMGAGNKLDPTRFVVTDLYQTTTCPLSKVMRRELRKRGILKLKVVYSPEEPLTPERAEPAVMAPAVSAVVSGAPEAAITSASAVSAETAPTNELPRAPQKRRIPGSVAFVPSVVGLIIAGEVIKDLVAEV